MITLRKITEENFEKATNLQVSVRDTDFVDTVEYSLAEAWLHYEFMRPFVICLDEEIIGFVSMYVKENEWQIINFFIADRFQKKTYGTQAAKLCIDFLVQEHKADRISLPVKLGNEAAKRFWTKLGFTESDTVEDGYVFVRKMFHVKHL